MKKKSISSSAFLNLRTLIGLILCAATAYFILIPIRSGLAFLHPQAPSNASQRTLSFEERVSYQRAIEDAYWRHRIWPKERKDPKPSLDAVMSQAQLEKKVKDYLRNSQALEDYWQRPITAEQLGVEMDRMTKHTKQPKVLRELFEALGNDPFVIAECLARPALAERLVTNWCAYDQRIHGELKQRDEAELQAHPSTGQMKQLSGKYSEIELVKSDATNGHINRRTEHSVQLNSREWNETVQKLAATFAAAEDHKTLPIGKLTSLQEDETRFYATAVVSKASDHLKLATVSWLKEPFDSWRARVENQMSVGMAAPRGNYTLPTISGNSCIDDTWTATSGAPSGRYNHTAIWTGSEMIVWGGWADVGAFFNTGGRYNPSTDSWTATSTANAPTARYYHTAVWAGSQMVVWGGYDDSSVLDSGSRYDPGTDSWAATITTNAPVARENHTAVWTGSEMIVWGGSASPFSNLNTGGRYNPGTDSWVATSTASAPNGRFGHSAIWAGSEMIIWGGTDISNFLDTGGRYNPGTNSWTATTTTNAPDARSYHTAVWTGSEMIVWGGNDFFNLNGVNTGGRYDPGMNTWTATDSMPPSREGHTVVWTGSEMITWGGYNGITLDTGERYNPGTDSWTATSTASAPDARSWHTAVWTSGEMIVWGGQDIVNSFNTGGRYNPNSDNWTPTKRPAHPMLDHCIRRSGAAVKWSSEVAILLRRGAHVTTR